MTTFIATCLMHTNGPSAPNLISSCQYQLAPSPRGSDVWALLMLGLARTLSINGVNHSHAVLTNVPTSTSSVVRQLARVSLTWNKGEHTGRLVTVRCFLALWPLLLHCFIVSHSRRLDTLLGHVVVLPSRLHPSRSASVVIVFLVTSLRDRNTFKQLMSESCCVVESL